MRRFLLLLIAFTVLGLIVLKEYEVYQYKQKLQSVILKTPLIDLLTEEGLKKGFKYKIESVRVQQPHEFEIKIYDVGWIKGQLREKAPMLARKPVIELFNNATDPKVILVEKVDNTWLIDIKLTVNAKEIDLVSWLKEQGFLFN